MMEGYSRPRNPAIASAFAYMKIIENGEPEYRGYLKPVRSTDYQSQS